MAKHNQVIKIGLFGGTFNPVHCGHLQVVTEVKNRFHLERLFIIPAALPPHKTAVDMAAAGDRLEMVRRSFSGQEGFSVSDVELRRTGPSYTIDTVRHFKHEFSQGTQLYLIVGLDAFLEIETWMHYEQLFKELPMIVMTRPGSWGADDEQVFANYLHHRISADYAWSEAAGSYVHPDLAKVYFTRVTRIDVSATGVRQAVRETRSLDGIVPIPVADYIHQKGLYV
jgi:nicotinate-nucleotide adenylyltransferase